MSHRDPTDNLLNVWEALCRIVQHVAASPTITKDARQVPYLPTLDA